LLATDEAVMLRRSYQGIGKRGIGVGYPGGVNLAFDAQQMRVGMIWKGKFADPGGVWRGQGSGNVRPLGSDLIRFPAGPELGRQPWESLPDAFDRFPDYQFAGYELDDLRRPAFLYRFGAIGVKDYFQDVVDQRSGKTTFKRTLTFEVDQPVDGLFFRLGVDTKITSIDDQTFLLGDRLQIRMDDNHAGRLIDRPEGKCLAVPLDLPAGSSQLTLQYAW
ncbi:MAG: hypothetical protein MI861_11245, partial [Pirellulales bacterium]|nr:hypothetical protein [Pirellulales bacterium]